MGSYFPYICGCATMNSLLIIYYLEIDQNLGIYTFIYGYFIHYLIQIVLSIALLAAKSPEGCYSFPGFRQLFSDHSKEISFLVNYSLAYLSELFSSELVPFILLYGSNPSLNIGVWSIIIQIINIVFYIGYSTSAYARSVCTQFLALKDFKNLKKHLLTISMYLFVTLSISNVLVYIFSLDISKLFFSDENSLRLLTQCLQFLSMFFVFKGFIIFLNSTLRMIGFDAFCFYSSIIIYVMLFPMSLLYITIKYQTGAFVAIGILFSFNTILCMVFVMKLLNGFKENTYTTFKSLHEENVSKMDNIGIFVV